MPDTSLCTLGNEKKNNIDLILLGDSHVSLAGAVDLWAKDLGLRGICIQCKVQMLYLPQIELFERRANE